MTAQARSWPPRLSDRLIERTGLRAAYRGGFRALQGMRLDRRRRRTNANARWLLIGSGAGSNKTIDFRSFEVAIPEFSLDSPRGTQTAAAAVVPSTDAVPRTIEGYPRSLGEFGRGSSSFQKGHDQRLSS